jgi:hypothetical protein
MYLLRLMPNRRILKMSKPRCLACKEDLVEEVCVLTPGAVKNHQPMFYCDNHRCPRYGLLSIYGLEETR